MFYPYKNMDEAKTFAHYNFSGPRLLVFMTDYRQLLLEYIHAIYPLKDPENDEIVDVFDECSNNWIGKDDFLRLIEKIKITLGRNNNRPSKMEREFYNNIIEWAEEKLEWANIMIIDGNL
jgi:hypothetical protein